MGIVCTDPNHSKHLCQMVALEKPLAEIKPYVKNAAYVCKFCARATNDPERVCKPVPLE